MQTMLYFGSKHLTMYNTSIHDRLHSNVLEDSEDSLSSSFICSTNASSSLSLSVSTSDYLSDCSWHDTDYSKCLNILYFNARSLLPKLEELRLLASVHRPNVICITESWLCKELLIRSCQLLVICCIGWTEVDMVVGC